MDLFTASSFNASDLPERAYNDRQDRISPSNSDSFTENTSDSTMSSLYEEQMERLQLENDLFSLDSSHMEEMDDWDTEINYNRLNYLTIPANNAPPNNTHDTFIQPFKHCPDSDNLSKPTDPPQYQP